MPYLKINTNIDIDKDNTVTIVNEASAEISKLFGKPENYIMIELNSSLNMSFAGTSDPLAYLELKSIGLPTEATAILSASLCSFITSHLKIDPARIYIEFADAERHLWGWNTSTF